MEDRKARLKALAEKAGRLKKPPEEHVTEQIGEDISQAALGEAAATNQTERTPYSFDNSKKRGTSTSADSRLDARGEPSSKRAKTSNENEETKSFLEKALEEAKADIPRAIAEDDVVAMAPKKINWDLKRDIQHKLDKLEKRTQKAIVKMLRERLEKEAMDDLD